jgi:hypothetical protein
MLEKKAIIYNVGTLLVKEMQYNRLHSQVGALESYVTAVEQRRVVLEAPALPVIQPAVFAASACCAPGAHAGGFAFAGDQARAARLPELPA